MSSRSKTPLTKKPSPFGPAWRWFFDDALVDWVKKTYSPKESWKAKPFSREDAVFFLRGVRELSDLFTESRPKRIPQYLHHPRFRSSYLLYFLPLQAAKFYTLFWSASNATGVFLKDAKLSGEAVVYDYGAGPGTASIALLLWMMEQPEDRWPKKVKFRWIDQNEAILKDGKKLVEAILEKRPEWKDRVEIQTLAQDWTRAIRNHSEKTTLVIFGNVLNETNADEVDFAPLFENAGGAGILFLEPAFKKASQLLSQLRDQWLENGVVPRDQRRIWGPCLHAGACPLSMGRDWCHFSVPIDIPGKWFKFFSKGLSEEREWLKFSYLWFSADRYRSEKAPAKSRLVVSDPLTKNPKEAKIVLLCEPEKPNRHRLKFGESAWRGDVIEI